MRVHADGPAVFDVSSTSFASGSTPFFQPLSVKEQSDLWDVVDGRLRLILGVIGIVFAASATFQRQVTLGGTAQIPFWIGLFVGLAVVLFLIAGAIVAFAYWPQEFNRPPDPIDLRNRWLTTDTKQVKLIVIDSILDARPGQSLLALAHSR